jgi:hypothetical protein
VPGIPQREADPLFDVARTRASVGRNKRSALRRRSREIVFNALQNSQAETANHANPADANDSVPCEALIAPCSLFE